MTNKLQYIWCEGWFFDISGYGMHVSGVTPSTFRPFLIWYLWKWSSETAAAYYNERYWAWAVCFQCLGLFWSNKCHVPRKVHFKGPVGAAALWGGPFLSEVGDREKDGRKLVGIGHQTSCSNRHLSCGQWLPWRRGLTSVLLWYRGCPPVMSGSGFHLLPNWSSTSQTLTL